MKDIKYFKYVKKEKFNIFLKDYGYKLEDVKGFSLAERRQYRGNVLKIYNIHFNDGESVYFKVVCFKSFNEYYECKLGFKGEKLLEWFEDADVRLI